MSVQNDPDAQRHAAVLRRPLKLPSGAVLANRLVKGAMSELVGDAQNGPTERHVTLYRTFAKGGAGLLLTGNVQVDRMHLEHPGNVAIDGEQDGRRLDLFRRWSAAAKSGGGQVWMQLCFTGRQTQTSVNPHPKAPSAVAVAVPGNRFGMPIVMTHEDILEVIRKFGYASGVAQDTGFDGVELHAAHGYIFNQFLSPRTNLRGDEWGGDLASRARFLLEVVKEIRRVVRPDFTLAVKLNSADFQRGGFSFEESLSVAGWLDEAGVDVIELSGGSVEQPKMNALSGIEPVFDPTVSRSTREREAYFARFVPEMRKHVSRAKMMVTGGYRTAKGMADSITDDGVDLIGLSRPLAVFPNGAAELLSGERTGFPSWDHHLRLGPGILGPKSPIALVKVINGFGSISWHNEQILAMADGKPTNPNMSLFKAFVRATVREKKMAGGLSGRSTA